jgi:RNA polymerase sigma-70 factor, ECF subfamily
LAGLAGELLINGQLLSNRDNKNMEHLNSTSLPLASSKPMYLPGLHQDLPITDAMNHEQMLLCRIVSGETATFAELVTPHRAIMFAATLPILDNRQEDAEECVQEALLKALANIRSFRGSSRFGTWLTQIAINEALMRRRKYRRSQYDSIEEMLTDGDGDSRAFELPDRRVGPAQNVDLNMLRQAVARALAELAPMYRDVLELREMRNLSTEETARKLSLTEAAVKTRLRRARQQMKELLDPAWGKHWVGCFATQPARTI